MFVYQQGFFQTPGRLTRRLKELLAHNAHARANLMLQVAPHHIRPLVYARTEAHQSENSRGVPLRRTEVAVLSAKSSGPSGETQGKWRFARIPADMEVYWGP